MATPKRRGRCGGWWEEGGREREHGFCTREDIVAVFGEGRKKLRGARWVAVIVSWWVMDGRESGGLRLFTWPVWRGSVL